VNRSRKQERDVARDIGGRATPASGAFWHSKGDVRHPDYLMELKRTDKASITLSKQVWEKIRREALLEGKAPALVLQIQDRQLAVLDWEDFLGLARIVADAQADLGEGSVP
jgi:hypothetical protein